MTSTNGFVTSVIINTILGVTYILLFSLLRTKYSWLYAPRTLPRYKSTEYGITHAPHSTSTFGWIFDTLAVRESDVLEQAGLDAVMFIRFFSVCFKIFLIASVWMIILVPINLTASMDNDSGGDDDSDSSRLNDFDRLSMSAVPAASPRLWAHLIAAYFLTAVVLYYFKRTWHDYLFLRHRWMRREHLKGKLTSLDRARLSTAPINRFPCPYCSHVGAGPHHCTRLVGIELNPGPVTDPATGIVYNTPHELLLLNKVGVHQQQPVFPIQWNSEAFMTQVWPGLSLTLKGQYNEVYCAIFASHRFHDFVDSADVDGERGEIADVDLLQAARARAQGGVRQLQLPASRA